MRVASKPNNKTNGVKASAEEARDGTSLIVRNVVVSRIRPEAGLDRKRDRDGHRELQRSIQQFGVLTPITVRFAPDNTGDLLLIKGQGRTLACRLLGIEKIPAIVVDDQFADTEKVRQFLVENTVGSASSRGAVASTGAFRSIRTSGKFRAIRMDGSHEQSLAASTMKARITS